MWVPGSKTPETAIKRPFAAFSLARSMNAPFGTSPKVVISTSKVSRPWREFARGRHTNRGTIGRLARSLSRTAHVELNAPVLHDGPLTVPPKCNDVIDQSGGRWQGHS